MGCWGFDFILELAIPLLIIAAFKYSESRNKLFVFITEICALLLVMFTILAVGKWQNSFYMVTGWNSDLEPTLPTYRVSLSVFFYSLLPFNFVFLRKKDDMPMKSRL